VAVTIFIVNNSASRISRPSTAASSPPPSPRAARRSPHPRHRAAPRRLRERRSLRVEIVEDRQLIIVHGSQDTFEER